MCGIFGIAYTPGSGRINVEKALADLDSLGHRGPDEKGHMLFDNRVFMGHRRLAVIDINGGSQPVCDPKQKAVATYNGEVYNFREIRERLAKKGHRFKTDCDSEVLPYLYLEKKQDMAAELRGMFAFAVYDRDQESITLFRDRLGQKPLWYYADHEKLVFASELAPILKTPGVRANVSPRSIRRYLALGYVPAPETIYSEIRKVSPGSFLKWQNGQVKETRYWRADFKHKADTSYPDACRQLREKLTEAVRLRLISDVPLGAFLSGGLDSSVVVGVMAGLCNEPVKTFSIGFNGKLYDETEMAALVSRKHGTEHRCEKVNPENTDVLKKMLRHAGEPFSDSSILPTYMVSRFTREKVTVALSGDGGDESAGGYYRYLVMRLAQKLGFVTPEAFALLHQLFAGILKGEGDKKSWVGRIKRLLEVLSQKPSHRYFKIMAQLGDEGAGKILEPSFTMEADDDPGEWLWQKFNDADAKDFTEKHMQLDLQTYLSDDVLTKVDIASMATSLEVRSPLLDHEVVELLASLPVEFKIRGGRRKAILEDAFKDLLPDEVLGRNKMGFSIPLATWLREGWRDFFQDSVLCPKFLEQGIFSRPGLLKMWNEHLSRRHDHSAALYAVLAFSLWQSEVNEKLSER